MDTKGSGRDRDAYASASSSPTCNRVNLKPQICVRHLLALFLLYNAMCKQNILLIQYTAPAAVVNRSPFCYTFIVSRPHAFGAQYSTVPIRL